MSKEELLELLDDLVYSIEAADKWDEVFLSEAFKKAKEITDNF